MLISPTTGQQLWLETATGGEPTEYALQAYTEGDCWLLAWALWIVFEEAGEDCQLALFGVKKIGGTITNWNHAAIALNDGTIVDINGESSTQQASEAWGAATILNESPDSLSAWEEMLDAEWHFESESPTSLAEKILEALYAR